MKFTVKTQAQLPVNVQAEAGRVTINGLSLLPHEAAIIADALSTCAESAEKQAQVMVYAAKYTAKSAALTAALQTVEA
jgi:uncharacterized protein YgbK (DUF1537 family)